MDVQTQAVTAAKLLTALVDGTDADQLNVQTPCAEWKVRDLMNHFIGGAHMFAAGLRGEVLSGEAPDDLVGSDHRASFHAALDSFGSALAATDDLERELTLPFGTMPAAAALQLLSGDLLVHCWDLATATGQPFDPPEDFVGSALAFFPVAIPADNRSPETFGPVVAVPEGSSAITRLLGYSGRTP